MNYTTKYHKLFKHRAYNNYMVTLNPFKWYKKEREEAKEIITSELGEETYKKYKKAFKNSLEGEIYAVPLFLSGFQQLYENMDLKSIYMNNNLMQKSIDSMLLLGAVMLLHFGLHVYHIGCRNRKIADSIYQDAMSKRENTSLEDVCC